MITAVIKKLNFHIRLIHKNPALKQGFLFTLDSFNTYLISRTINLKV